MADELITDQDVAESKQAMSQSTADMLNDPRIMSRMVRPDGTTAKILPSEVDAAVRAGYRPFNPDSEWEVKLSSTANTPIKIKGSELADYVNRGAYTDKAAQFMKEEQQLQDYIANEKANVDLTALETVQSAAQSAASGLTFGLSDAAIAARMKLQGALTGDTGFANDVLEATREAREKTGKIGIAAEVLGGIGQAILSGGLAPGASLLSHMGVGAAEGAAQGIGSTFGRQALGDESINAESYLLNAGLGSFIGGMGGGIGKSLGAIGKRARAPEDLNISFDDLSTMKGDLPVQISTNIYDNGKVIGSVDLSRNIEGYHVGPKMTGVTLEGIKLADDAPQDAIYNVIKKLTTEYQSVSSPTDLANFTPGLRKEFSNVGNRKLTPDSDDWFMVTPETLPGTVTDDPTILKYGKALLDKFGRTPEDGRPRELLEKLFEAKNSKYRAEFDDFNKNTDVRINTVTKDFKDVSDMAGKQVRLAEKAKQEIGNLMTEDTRAAMTTKLAAVQSKLRADADRLVGYKNADGTDVAGLLDSGESRQLASNLRLLAGELDNTIKNTDPVEAWKGLQAKLKDVGTTFYGKNNKGGLKKTMENFAPGVKMLDEAYGGMRDALSSDEIIGKIGSETLNDIQNKSAIAIEAKRLFMKEFGSNQLGKQVLDKRKIANAYTAMREGTISTKLEVLDTYIAAANDFSKAVKRAQGKGFLQGVDIPDATAVNAQLNRVNTYREFQEINKMLSAAKSGTGTRGAMTSTAATLGSVFGASVGGAFGGFPGLVAAGVASNLATIPFRAGADAHTYLKLAKQGDKALSRILNITNKLAEGSSKSMKAAATAVNRLQIVRALGVKHAPRDDNKTYITNVKQRLMELAHPDTLSQIQGTTGNPFLEDALQAKAKGAFDYILGKLPATDSYSSVNRVDAAKVDKMLFAAVNPIRAYEKAIKEGDTDIAQHIQAMFPTVYALLQSKVMGADTEALPYQQRAKIQRVTGIPATKVSDRAVKAARSVFTPVEKTKQKNPNITGPSLPTGSAIQDQ